MVLPERLHDARGEPEALMAESHLCRRRWSYLLFQVTDYLVSVGTSVATARDMYPIILTICRFENQLIEITVVLNPVKPLVSSL